MSMPNAIPSILPAGEYRCTILAEAEEKESRYDSSKTYFLLPLEVVDDAGESFDFRFCFSRKHPMYAAILKALGGVTDALGITSPPPRVEGKKFRATIIQRPHRQDATKTVNEIVSVTSIDGPPKAAARPMLRQAVDKVSRKGLPSEDHPDVNLETGDEIPF